jgi:hypothetical protein
MGNQESYDKLIGKVTAVPDNEIIPISMPSETMAQEAENTREWAFEDKDELVAAGLDWALVEELTDAAGALRKAESNWFIQRFGIEEAKKIWQEKSPVAYTLHDELIRVMRFAYRKDPVILSRVAEIAAGTGPQDMIQDLGNIYVLGNKYPDQLKAIPNFKMELLDEAERLSSEMARILAVSSANASGSEEAKVIRDKAFTYVKKLLDEIRTYGQFVFRNNKARVYGYASTYYRDRASSKNKKTSEQKTATVTA